MEVIHDALSGHQSHFIALVRAPAIRRRRHIGTSPRTGVELIPGTEQECIGADAVARVDVVVTHFHNPRVRHIPVRRGTIDYPEAVDVRRVGIDGTPGSRVVVAVRTHSGREREASGIAQPASPYLRAVAVAMVIRDVALVKPRKRRKKVLIEILEVLIREGVSLLIKAAGALRAYQQV